MSKITNCQKYSNSTLDSLNSDLRILCSNINIQDEDYETISANGATLLHSTNNNSYVSSNISNINLNNNYAINNTEFKKDIFIESNTKVNDIKEIYNSMTFHKSNYEIHSLNYSEFNLTKENNDKKRESEINSNSIENIENNYDDLVADVFDESFQLEYIHKDLNDSINILKNKLVPGDYSEEISVKRKRNFANDNISINKDFSYYGLPSKVKNLVKKHKGIDKLYEWQDECLNLTAIKERRNLIYALPTSGGKTLVAELLMLKEIICNKKNGIFVLPFVALVQEKIQSMIPFALDLNFLIEEYAGEKGHYPPKKRRKKNTLYICTIEKAHSIINCLIELDRLNEIGIIVIDELHLLGENGGRGANLETMLTKLMHFNSAIQIIGMSATIGNINEIAKFLNAELYVQNFRPIQIQEYVKCENKIWVINNKEEEMLTDMKILNYKYSKKAQEIDPDFLGGLVMDVAPKDSCLIFCSNKKNCENVALLLTQVLFRSVEEYKKEEKLALISSLESEDNVICPILNKTIKFGVAYHHSGLTSEERRLLEDAFRNGVLCVICCTSTLAAGVNLPARRVILRSPYIGREFLNLSHYKQMIGRAGRAGLGEIGESILIFNNSDISKVKELLSSKMNDSNSSLHEEEDRGINNLLISSVLLSKSITRFHLHQIVSKSLLKIQENRLQVDVKKITDNALINLLKNGTIKVKTKKIETNFVKPDISILIPSQQNVNSPKNEQNMNQDSKKIVVLNKNTELELSPLGKAALKGSISLNSAFNLYQDLRKAQKSLVLIDYLHLLYLVTPYEISSQIKPIGTIYYEVVTNLSPYQIQVARIVGINESVVDKLRIGIIPKNVDFSVINRFYVTLILSDLWNHVSLHDVSQKYQINRGIVQNLLSTASSFAVSVVRFCQELEEFSVFVDLLNSFSKKLTYCCASELEPLMELPYVKIGRAKQLYKAGFKTLQLIAKTDPKTLQEKIEHMPRRVANQIISAAKMLLLQKVENLRDEVAEVLDGLEI